MRVNQTGKNPGRQKHKNNTDTRYRQRCSEIEVRIGRGPIHSSVPIPDKHVHNNDPISDKHVSITCKHVPAIMYKCTQTCPYNNIPIKSSQTCPFTNTSLQQSTQHLQICPYNNVPIAYKHIPSKCNQHAQCKNAVPIVNEQVQSYNKAGK